MLRRMAANLLANATQAAGPAGSVTIEVARRGDSMLLAVEDDGPGFGRVPEVTGLAWPPWPEKPSSMREDSNAARATSAAAR